MNETSWFKTILKNNDLVEKIKNISLIITDIDGTLTDGNIYPHENSEETKGYSVQDGFATVAAQRSGLKIAFLTGKTGKLIEKRADTLSIPKNLQYLGCCNNNDKPKAVEKIKSEHNLKTDSILFFGDDVLDVEAKEVVSLFVCPENSIFYIKPQANFIVPKNGGEGAFRLLLDLVLYVQNKHFKQELIDNALAQ